MCRKQSLMPGPMGDATIPVEFSIPSDAYESYHDQPDDKVLWLLHAQADVPGVNYSDDFEVPVFRLTSSPASASVSTAFLFAGAGRNRARLPSTPMPPTSPLRRTQKLSFLSGRTAAPNSTSRLFAIRARSCFCSSVTAVWTAIVYFLVHYQHAPWFFGPVFGFFDLFLIYGLIKSAMGSCRIEVGNGKIIFRRAMLGIGAAREFLSPTLLRF